MEDQYPVQVFTDTEEVTIGQLKDGLIKLKQRIDQMAKSAKDNQALVNENSIKIWAEIKDIASVIDKPLQKTYIIRPRHSETIAALAGALAKAQGAMSLAETSGSSGKGGSSANMGDLIQAAVPHLSANDLAVSFWIDKNEFGEGICLMKLLHSSGEWLEAESLLMEDETMKNEIEYQKRRGGAITYTMKNMYRAMICLGKDPN